VTPDLILPDPMMPRMNGYEFLRELDRRGLRGAFSILIVTADARAKQKAEHLGAESYVAKPFEVTKFLDKVRKLTQRERAD
jgi:CheY-like chemotaxis protein